MLLYVEFNYFVQRFGACEFVKLILNVLKDLTRPTRLYFRLHNKWTRPFFGRYFGLLSLDAEIEKYLPYKNGYFVELGANDGISQSNTKYFELFKGWSGVLVEPYHENYIKCTKNRKSSTKTFHAACVPTTYTGKDIQLIYSNLMTITLNEKNEVSNQLEHANEGIQFLDPSESVHSFVAPARTLQSILDEAKSPERIDLLSLDVEGFEMEVLEGLDHEKYRFQYICIESRNLELMKRYLSSKSYSFVTTFKGGDSLFVNERI